MTKAIATRKPQFSLEAFGSTVLAKFKESIFDMVVTVALTGASLAYMSITVHPWLVQTVSGYYIFAMLIAMFIRIVRRFDESYTTQEVGEKLDNYYNDITQRLDTISRNV